MNRGKRGGFQQWFRRGGAQGGASKGRAVMSKAGNGGNDIKVADEYAAEENGFSIKAEPGCPYDTWKLYFPKRKYSDSHHINRRILAMKDHFRSFSHLYDFDAIADTFVLRLPLKNLVGDNELDTTSWPTWYEDFLSDPKNSLCAISLALHDIVEGILKKRGEMFKTLKKIYVRPIGWRPFTPLKDVKAIDGQLVSTCGVVKSIEAIEAVAKYICFQCTACSAELCVKQLKNQEISRPSVCSKSCKARSGFIPLFTSPHTIIAPRQKLILSEVAYQMDEADVTLEVELSEDQVACVSAGGQIVITGIVCYRNLTHNPNQAKNYTPYFKCSSVVVCKGMDVDLYNHMQNNEIPEVVDELRTERNIFKVLVDSFCPEIYGREEAKAALLLGLLSGNELLENRRSDSHILLLGNPGTGKSKLLMMAAFHSPRGMFVSGSIVSVAGLTVSVGQDGTVNAGALALSDNGDCCIDEFDKTVAVQSVLLEAMEQQEISIAKSGAVTSLSARCSVITAANPCQSTYDRSKTIVKNVKFSPQLLSRFDLIVPFIENVQSNNSHFTDFMINRSKGGTDVLGTPMQQNQFFESPQSKQKPRIIQLRQVKNYIEYVKQTCHPKLTSEATDEIRKFFLEHSELCRDKEDLQAYGSSRFVEGLIRLSLSRARAEMATEATAEHVKDIIYLIKCTLIDIYDEHDIQNRTANMSANPFAPIKRKNVESGKPLSKPKQMKAFLELLNEKVDEEQREVFTVSEMKAMAKEMGIKDFDDILYRLNNEGSILKTANGYRIV